MRIDAAHRIWISARNCRLDSDKPNHLVGFVFL